MADSPVIVFDSFALLVYFRDEPGAARIEQVLKEAQLGKCNLVLSIINLGELLYIVERKGGISRAQDILTVVRQLPIEILPADESAVFSAAHIKANYRLSYADAFAAAATQDKNAILLTGDPEFQALETIVQIEWLVK